uniref:cytochrome P450 Tp4149-like n=1 Tax=Erigeron canadensis TaxID=72917 RepID=UPI001CB97556|nr:cytochrome P450 Tp4149-like [Erigeron canadensis]
MFPSLFEIIHIPLNFLFVFLLFLITFKLLSLTSNKTPRNPPPTLRKLPIIGNLHQLGSSPHHTLRALSHKHGPLLLMHLGSIPLLVASSAEAAKEILKTHDLIFANRPKLYFHDKLSYGSKDIGFAPYGEHWRQVKSITVLHLLSRKQVQSFRKIREKQTIHMLEMMGKSCGSVINLTELLFLLTINILCEVAFGKKGDLKFMDLMARMQILLGGFDVGSYIPCLSWVNWLHEGQANKVVKEYDEFFDGVIDEHINKSIKMDVNDTKGRQNEGRDIVDILLDVQRDNTLKFKFGRDTIKAVIFDVFTAGIEATSSSIEWALSEIIRHPRVMKKLQTEVTQIAQGRSMITEDDLHEMPYLKVVMKESLRLHVPIPLLVPREAREDVKVMGYDIAKGTQVMINAWAIARDPSNWEEPDKFYPERFLNSSIDYKGFDFELIPFGAGRRGCPGAEFAMVIDELVIANMLLKFDLAMPNDGRPEELDMTETLGFTVKKKSNLLVVPSSRLELSNCLDLHLG